MDANALRRLMQMGQITEDDLRDMQVSGSSGDQNALAQMMQPMPQPRYDIAPLAANNMRFENGPDQGRVVPLGPQQGENGMPSGMPSAPAAPKKIRLIGNGDGQTIDLGTEDLNGRPQLDMSRSPIDIPGVGKAFYSKDGRGAFVMQNGEPTARVLLGYDDAASRQRNSQNLAMDKTRQDMAQSQASVEHAQEQIRASRVNNPDMMAGGSGSGLSGNDLLGTLDAGTGALIKQMVEGRMAPPTGAALKNPRIVQMLALANQYDPGFDSSTWAERYKTAQDYATGGKSGQQLKALNTAIHHAGQLQDASDQLGNFDGIGTMLNTPVNWIEQKLGATEQGTYKMKADALASELRKVYSGAGAGTQKQLEEWQSHFDQNASHEQQTKYLQGGLELLTGALDALKDNYTRGMGPRADFSKFVAPDAQATLDKLLTGKKTGAPTAPPQAGSVEEHNGKRFLFLGGNPADQSRWKPVS